MIRQISSGFFILLVTACSTTQVPDAAKDELVIKGVSQGKMRKVDGEYVIYEHTSDMVYEENDRCGYDGEPIDCLRHGFKIEYEPIKEDVKLDCIARTNIAVNAGNVAREKYVDTREDDFYIPLETSKNEFVNVQYISGQPGLEDLLIETSCAYNGKEVLRFSQRVRF
jgi:hypothetical protein